MSATILMAIRLVVETFQFGPKWRTNPTTSFPSLQHKGSMFKKNIPSHFLCTVATVCLNAPVLQPCGTRFP